MLNRNDDFRLRLTLDKLELTFYVRHRRRVFIVAVRSKLFEHKYWEWDRRNVNRKPRNKNEQSQSIDLDRQMVAAIFYADLTFCS